MYDDDGKEYRRRYSDQGLTKWAVSMSGPILLGLFSWGITVEIRLNNMATVQQERGPIFKRIDERLALVEAVAGDPAPRPQAKVMLDRMHEDHDHMMSRIDRLEERFNNFHQFLLQAAPTLARPGRKGELSPVIEMGNRGG